MALRLGIFLALVALSTAQFMTQGGYYGQGGFGQQGFGQGFLGRQPVGFQGAIGFQGNIGGPTGVATMGYDPFYSQLYNQPVYAQNLGVDQTYSTGADCMNGGRRFPGGPCVCNPGYSGAACQFPPADTDTSPGFVCLQTPGDATAIAAELTRAQTDPTQLSGLQGSLRNLMASGGQAGVGANPTGVLIGPGFATDACAPVPNRGPVSPKLLKSALTDYGFIVCSEQQLCYNQECPPCTRFSTLQNTCVHDENAAQKGVSNECQTTPGEMGPAAKARWYAATLNNPRPTNPGGAPVGNAFFPGAGMGAGGIGGAGIGAGFGAGGIGAGAIGRNPFG